MIISKSHIRSLNANLPARYKDDELIFAITNIEEFEEKLHEVGFENLEVGETVLPKPIGKHSIYNAEGKYIKHKNQEKETVYHQRPWSWKEWRGPYKRVERTKIVDVPYERYPRTFVPPPSEELSVKVDDNDNKYIASRPVKYIDDNEGDILHIINLFLELFEKCVVLDENLQNLKMPELKRLNWEVLPPGEYPWEKVKSKADPVINQQPKKVQTVIRKRLDTINKLNPDFYAVGRGGFSGYIIFGFSNKGLYILESTRKNNATYIFGEDWKTLSKMTKAEILSENKQETRIIHRKFYSWINKVKNLLED